MNQQLENKLDQSHHYINTTCEIFPLNLRTHEQTQIFLGCKIDPFKEKQPNSNLPKVPVLANNSKSILQQCKTCRGYLNPWVKFHTGGRAWKCNFCGSSNDVPNESFSNINKNGIRFDHFQIPELTNTVLEYEMEKNPQIKIEKNALFLFLIDVSKNSIKNGIISAISSTLEKLFQNNFRKQKIDEKEKEKEKDKENENKNEKEKQKENEKEQEQEGSNISVGFITYNSTVHLHYFSSINQNPKEGKGSNFQPKKSRMYILPDTKDIYLPYKKGMFAKLDKNGKKRVETFLKGLNKMFQNTNDQESCLGSALKVLLALDLSVYNSKIMIFQNTLPRVGLYHLENRVSKIYRQNSQEVGESGTKKSKINITKKIFGTTYECQLLLPALHNGKFYSTIGKTLANGGHAVFLFLFGKEYLDISTLSRLSLNTNGEIFYYPRIDLQKRPDLFKTFSSNLKKIFTQWYVNNVTARTRVSNDIFVKSSYGYNDRSIITLTSIPSMASYNSLCFDLSMRAINNIQNRVYIQFIVLYDLQNKQKRLRIITREFKTSDDYEVLFKSINLDLLYHFYIKIGITNFNAYSSKKIVSTLIYKCKKLIKIYLHNKNNKYNLINSPINDFNRLNVGNKEKQERDERFLANLPNNLKLIAFYTCSLVKSNMFRYSTSIDLEHRSFLLRHFATSNMIETKSYICPLFYSIPSSLHNYQNSHPTRIPLTKKSLKTDGLFLITNSTELILLIGANIDSKIVNYLFDLDSIGNTNSEDLMLLKLNNNYNKYVWNFIHQIQLIYFRKMPIHLIKFGIQKNFEKKYNTWFVEDQTLSFSSYQDFISTLEHTLKKFKI
ncbi:sec24-related protein [Anaeramoeba flamelloides]|uniref:Sec24-related protein n=1 Tax=Anaeramoeba flamelloides TaxID=1746091 RepID=A0ABQ8Z6C7_9EUKA|nr:sec24-related protein [Anaeramoeba flamelloides]